MFYSHKSAAIFTSTILALGFATQAFGQATHAGAVGTVDRDKVITSYPKAQQYADELKKAEDKVHKLIEDSNKTIRRCEERTQIAERARRFATPSSNFNRRRSKENSDQSSIARIAVGNRY